MPRLLRSIAIAFIGISLFVPVAEGQTFTYAEECISTVDNATVHLPANADLSFPDGTPVEAGDTLAVYTAQGICAGYGVWEEGEGATFAASGSDSLEVTEDGYTPEEDLKFEVFDVSAGNAADIGPAATFASCDSLGVPVCAEGGYEDGTFHQVADFQADSTVTRTLTLTDGWNFISIPVQSDLSFETLLPSCSSGFFYTPGEGYTAIEEGGTLPVGTGAAVQCQADTTSVTGTPASPTIEVEAGWNLIGSVEDTVDVDAVKTSPSGILSSDFFELPPGAGYETATMLQPGEGYWVKVSEAGSLDVSGGSAPLASTSEATDESAEAHRLVFEDASGRQSKLLLKEGLVSEQLSTFEMPPVPPEGVFDIRFASGHEAASLASEGGLEQSATNHRLDVQGVDFPIEVRLETDAEDRRFVLSAGGDEFTLSSEQTSVQVQKSTGRFAVAAAPNPREFRFGAVYPNPIRGQATLEYALPKAATVSIAVYDMLGRQVTRLVERKRRTGVYQARVDATQLASGKYFVRMQAGSFQKTRQLTVVR